jgi:hypothetical protein
MTSANETPNTEDVMDTFGENTCHVLPCNVDYCGMAPAHIYFHPKQLEEGICASTFRGRGLLATNGKHSAVDGSGKTYLLSMKENKLYVKASIDNVLEWQHEHNPSVLKYQDERTRFQIAQEWCAIASAVSKRIIVDIKLLFSKV